MNIAFEPVTRFPRGTLCRLLRDAYSFQPEYERAFLKDWEAFDNFFYDNPKIADKYGFVTTVDGEPVGHVSWDPRHIPEYAIMGHNCIATRFKGRELGKAQMKEAVARIAALHPRKIIVTTNTDLLPAQRTYESAGFVLKRVRPIPDSFFGGYMDYECPMEP